MGQISSNVNGSTSQSGQAEGMGDQLTVKKSSRQQKGQSADDACMLDDQREQGWCAHRCCTHLH